MRPLLLLIHNFECPHVIVRKGMQAKPMVLWRLSNYDFIYRDIRSVGSSDEADRQTDTQKDITVISVA